MIQYFCVLLLLTFRSMMVTSFTAGNDAGNPSSWIEDQALSCSQFPPMELAVLQDLYNSGQGEGWVYTSSGMPWDFNQPNPNPCYENWAFINCSTSCSIAEILFYDSNYIGTLPSSISNLTNLVSLGFKLEPKLTGTLPSTIGKV